MVLTKIIVAVGQPITLFVRVNKNVLIQQQLVNVLHLLQQLIYVPQILKVIVFAGKQVKPFALSNKDVLI